MGAAGSSSLAQSAGLSPETVAALALLSPAAQAELSAHATPRGNHEPSSCAQAANGAEPASRSTPPPPAPAASAHAGIPLLQALDAKLLAALRNAHIKLVSADYLRAGKLQGFARRQDLERRQRERPDERIFLSPDEAVRAMTRGNRSIGALTYGWATPDASDVDAVYLRALVRFLNSPLGSHIVGVFVDFMSLAQYKRTADEDVAFGAALGVMAHLYASATGTTVVRHKALPPRPAALDGELVLLGGDSLERAADTCCVTCYYVAVRAYEAREADVV